MTRCDEAERLDEFALGGLSAEERERILLHLQSCEQCTQEAGDYLEALTVMALHVPQNEPPRSLGRAIMAAVGGASLSGPLPLKRRWWSHWPAAAAAAIAAVSLGWSVQLASQLEQQRAALASLSRRYDTVVGVLAASEVNIKALSATEAAPGAMGRIFLDSETGSGMIMHRLPPLPEGHVYQLWFVRKGERLNGGVLRTNPDGSGYTIIQAPGPVAQFEAVGITREPAGGSQWPTSERLLGAGI